MARTDTLGNFLTDVADAIRTKTGSSEPIQASSFDTAIENIPSGGGNNEISNSIGVYYEFNWQNLTLPSDRITVAYLFYNWKNVRTMPKVIFTSTNTNVGAMYSGCTSMNFVDMSGWDISNIISFSNTFSTCTTLTGTSNFAFPTTTCNGNDVSLLSMFEGCTGLVDLDLSALHINNIRVLTTAFKTCSKLKTLDIRNFTLSSTSEDVRLDQIFRGCSALTHIDMRGLDFVNTQIYNYANMLMNVPTNCEIIVKDTANKTWLSTKFSSYTNIKTVEEYEAE